MSMETATRQNEARYLGRWQHRMTLHFRVWPKFKETHQAIVREKVIPVNGMRIGSDGTPEVWNMTSAGVCGQIFEMGESDFETIAAIPDAGARQYGRMRILAPGSDSDGVKKECWLEVGVLANRDAPERKITFWGENWNGRAPHEIFGETPEDALGLNGIACGKVVFIEKDADIDEDAILREVLENDAMIVLNRRPIPGQDDGVSTEAGLRLVARAMFWTVPDRAPDEPGGILRGYQFADRIVRFHRRVDEENRAENHERLMGRMHEKTREKGRANRRRYFIEEVSTRFAECVGWPRQRVVERFIADGVVDWLTRSVDAVKPVQGRETWRLLNGRVNDAVRAVEFYYRALEAMSGDGKGGAQ